MKNHTPAFGHPSARREHKKWKNGKIEKGKNEMRNGECI
jgi:hypothetical protein